LLNLEKKPVKFARKNRESLNPFITEAIRRECEQMIGQRCYTDGVKIRATIKSRVQDAAERSMKTGFDNLDQVTSPYPAEEEKKAGKCDGAFIAINPITGAVLALVGGRDWTESQLLFYDAKIQPGSGAKPVTLATAYSLGMTPDTKISDAPIIYRGRPISNYGKRRPWRDGGKDAIKSSINRIAVRYEMFLDQTRWLKDSYYLERMALLLETHT